MAESISSTQVAVIGGGPGGYAAAFAAADLGLEVALINDAPNPGGVCLYRGCIPSKALLHAAKVIGDARAAAQFGLQFSDLSIDVDQLRAWKDKVVQNLTGGLGTLTKQRGITYVQGRASFVDERTLEVKGQDGSSSSLSFEHAIIATGSRPISLPSIDLDSPRLMDSTKALALEEVPERLLVIGGSYIGLELATVYHSLGSQVTVVEMEKNLLPAFDQDLVRVLASKVKREFASVLLGTKVVAMEEREDGILVRFESDESDVKEETFDRVLVAVGRRPNSENLGLEKIGVKVGDRGFIEVDLERRTSVPHIFAIGDVAGEPMLAHKASHEGRVAAEVIHGRRVAFEPRAIPAVVFTDPELAVAGLSEAEAKAMGREVNVVRFPWGASGRAMTLGRTDGLTKLIVDAETELVLGMGIVGPGAGELIAEGVLAIEMGAVAEDIMLTIHAHPTLSETVMEAAEMIYGQATHVYRRK